MARVLAKLRDLDLTDVRIRARLWLQYLRLRHRYGEAAPRPRRLIDVDPTDIEYTYFPLLYTTEPSVTKPNTYVLGGD